MVIPRQWIPKQRNCVSVFDARMDALARESREQFQPPVKAMMLFEHMTTAQRRKAAQASANSRLAREFAKRVK